MPSPKWSPRRHALASRKKDKVGWIDWDQIRKIHHPTCPSCLGEIWVPWGEAIDGTPVCRKCVPNPEDHA